jgi:asparagine synthase (glutamine-hydrolysing)
MCGIAGFVLASTGLAAPDAVLRRMTDTLVHRGPDGSGYWFEREAGVGLGHRRLAIVDLSDAGRQPMFSQSKRFGVVFNGEIYNFQDLRTELEQIGCRFRGRSDTEVMLAAFEHWGVDAAVRRFVGMFAIALWDATDRTLILIRDRLGKKPIYYGRVGQHFVFGSELKALRAFPGFAGDVDRNALTLYLRHNYIPSPWSIYRGVAKLPAGSLLRIRVEPSGAAYDAPLVYWSVEQVFSSSSKSMLPDLAATDRADELLRKAVATRMIADVPLGAFLSGGIDSSLVVALMQAQSSRPVRTFSIGFREAAYDEAPYARAIAKHLGTDHTEVYLSADDALAVIPRLPHIFDEPFSDSSQIPTYLVSEAARRGVTVALSGDGGDELFCGYTRYMKWRKVWHNMQRVPRFARTAIARAIQHTPFGALRMSGLGHKFNKLSEILLGNDPSGVYLRFISHWLQPDRIVIGGHEPLTVLNRGGGPRGLDAFTDEMMKLDVLTYLPDDILVKVDRASMAVSLESRAPILDHRVVEFAAQLPLHQKLRGATTKWIVRRVLERYVPPRLFNRPKMGFGVPIDTWLRGPLRDWAEDLLGESRMRQDGYLDPVPVRRLWLDHQDRRRDSHYLLWDVLMFQSWLRDVHTRQSSVAA